jgi:hypothetical protein
MKNHLRLAAANGVLILAAAAAAVAAPSSKTATVAPPPPPAPTAKAPVTVPAVLRNDSASMRDEKLAVHEID